MPVRDDPVDVAIGVRQPLHPVPQRREPILECGGLVGVTGGGGVVQLDQQHRTMLPEQAFHTVKYGQLQTLDIDLDEVGWADTGLGGEVVQPDDLDGDLVHLVRRGLGAGSDIETDLPAETKWLNYGVVLSGRGFLWADNFRLTFLDEYGNWRDLDQFA